MDTGVKNTDPGGRLTKRGGANRKKLVRGRNRLEYPVSIGLDPEICKRVNWGEYSALVQE